MDVLPRIRSELASMGEQHRTLSGSDYLAAQNINTPGGQFRRPDSSISVTVDTALNDVAEFETLITAIPAWWH